MRSSTRPQRRFGGAVLSALSVKAIANLFLAWVGLGLQEARDQWIAVDALKRVGGTVFYDYFDDKSDRLDIPNRWRDPGWLVSTPRWSSRWWISTFTDIDPPLGTVVCMHFDAEEPMSDAQWEYFCRAFSSAYIVDVNCPVRDRQLRFLKHMPRLGTLNFVNEEDRPVYTLGEGLGQLKSLRDLKYLGFKRVALSAAGKTAIGSLENLNALFVMGEADDDILANISRLKRLSGLHLSGPRITDAGLVHLRKLPDLRNLTLMETAITDDGLRHLEGLKIEDLCLADTKVSDRGMTHVARIPALVRLNLATTGLTDAAIPELAKLKNLQHLCLFGTKVTPSGCSDLVGALPNLKTLYEPSMRGGAYGF